MHEHNLIVWNADCQKWSDTGNDYFCAPTQAQVGTEWRVSARYGFPDGSHTKTFPNEIEAMTYFINFLHTRAVNFIVEGYEILDRKRNQAA